MKELVDLIKANPGKYNYASPGAGTGPHLSAELLKLTFGLDLTHVPFRGAGPAVQSVTGGHNPIGCVALPPAVPLVKGGQILGLALTSPARFPSVPDVPTMAEQGIKGQEATTMQAFLVPAATPKPIVDFLYNGDRQDRERAGHEGALHRARLHAGRSTRPTSSPSSSRSKSRSGPR